MSEPFLGQLMPTGFNFAPRGWALCDGQLLSISQNAALFSLLGTQYGGDGRVTFGLPNLRGRTPVHFDSQLPLGSSGGAEAVTLTLSQIPAHNHAVQANTGNAALNNPSGAVLAVANRPTPAPPRPVAIYQTPGTPAPMNAETIAIAGGSQPHSNMQPYLVINWIIALQGIFPSRS